MIKSALMGLLALAAGMMLSASVGANCVGSGAFQTCYDAQSGNSYQINRMGNMTQIQGSNPRTGSNWSQTSQDFGNTTRHSGRAANGNTWNSTETQIGNTRIINGTDSRGNPFSKTCNQFGCY